MRKVLIKGDESLKIPGFGQRCIIMVKMMTMGMKMVVMVMVMDGDDDDVQHSGATAPSVLP